MCVLCEAESGTSLVCRFCRRNLSDYQHTRITIMWHEQVVQKGYDPERDQVQCFHCRHWFSREEVCGDHWPHTKKRRPDLRYDVTNGVCCCKRCNTSGARTRKKP